MREYIINNLCLTGECIIPGVRILMVEGIITNICISILAITIILAIIRSHTGAGKGEGIIYHQCLTIPQIFHRRIRNNAGEDTLHNLCLDDILYNLCIRIHTIHNICIPIHHNLCLPIHRLNNIIIIKIVIHPLHSNMYLNIQHVLHHQHRPTFCNCNMILHPPEIVITIIPITLYSMIRNISLHQQNYLLMNSVLHYPLN